MKNTEALAVASKKTGLEVNSGNNKNMVMSRNQNARLSHTIKTDNSSIESVEVFKCLGTNLTDQNFIQEEIKSKLKMENASYHLVQNLLSCSLLFEKIYIKIYRTVILIVVLYGCETWLLTLREEHKLRVLRRIFGPKRDEVRREWRKIHNEELNDLYSSPNTIWVIKFRRTRWVGHVARMGERICAYRVWVGKVRERDHLEDPGVDGRILFRRIFSK